MNKKSITIVLISTLVVALVGLPKLSLKNVLAVSKDYQNKISKNNSKLPNSIIKSKEDNSWLISKDLGDNFVILNTKTLEPLPKESEEWEKLKKNSNKLDSQIFSVTNLSLEFKKILLKKNTTKVQFALANNGDLYKFTPLGNGNKFPQDYQHTIIASLGLQGSTFFTNSNPELFKLKISPEFVKFVKLKDHWKVDLNPKLNVIAYSDFVVLGVNKKGSQYRSGKAVLLTTEDNNLQENAPDLDLPEERVIEADENLIIPADNSPYPTPEVTQALPQPSNSNSYRNPLANTQPSVSASTTASPTLTPTILPTIMATPTYTPTSAPTSSATASASPKLCCDCPNANGTTNSRTYRFKTAGVTDSSGTCYICVTSPGTPESSPCSANTAKSLCNEIYPASSDYNKCK